MRHEPNERNDELHEIIETKLAAMMIELQDGNWSTTDVAFALRDVLQSKWLNDIEALQAARGDMPENFVSDGDEG